MPTRFFLLFVLLVGVAIAVPIQSRAPLRASHLDQTFGSRRIFCTEIHKHITCQKSEATIIHQSQDASPLGERYSTPIAGLGQQAAEELHRIRIIMDIKGQLQVGVLGKHQVVPNVQVVLWIILLCCLAEGIVTGFRWWCGCVEVQGSQKSPTPTKEHTDSGKITEEDDDDELNIPVL